MSALGIAMKGPLTFYTRSIILVLSAVSMVLKVLVTLPTPSRAAILTDSHYALLKPQSHSPDVPFIRGIIDVCRDI